MYVVLFIIFGNYPLLCVWQFVSCLQSLLNSMTNEMEFCYMQTEKMILKRNPCGKAVFCSVWRKYSK